MEQQDKNQANEDRFIDVKQVAHLLGVSRIWVLTRIGQDRSKLHLVDPSFPKPRKVGRRTMWWESEIRKWMCERPLQESSVGK
jgi:predicted DNA-binding transcriptional regulator AlpA